MSRGPVSGAVLQALAELRYATPAQVADHIGTFTLVQVQRALHTLVEKKALRSTGIGSAKGSRGRVAATYWLPGDDPPEVDRAEPDLWKPNRIHQKRPQYVSVWHYAERMGAAASRAQIPKL